MFHDEYYISSTLPHEDIQPLYSYLVGCGESHRDNGAAFRPLKVHTYKEAGNSFRVKPSQEKIELDGEVLQFKVGEEFQDEDKLGMSPFGKINQKSLGVPVTSKTSGFLIGPIFEGGDFPHAEIFSPKVFIKGECYRMLVYQGHRCTITLLFKVEDSGKQYPFTY